MASSGDIMLPPNNEYNGVERRSEERIYTLIPAELTKNGLEELVKVTNVSFGGCALKCVQLLNTEDKVHLSFFNADESEEDIYKYEPINARVVNVEMEKTEFSVSLAFAKGHDDLLNQLLISL